MGVRTEEHSDRAAVYAVNASAFETQGEARLVEALRERAWPLVSLVAEDCGRLVGHILFSPVTLAGHPELAIMGLAPLAVVPAWQRTGIGTALVRAGLERCRKFGFDAVVVLGHPDYYRRFGFVAASRFGIGCEYEVPDESFMIIELKAECFAAASGVVKYDAAFDHA